MTIKFCGAAGEVTGSKHLITTANGKRILLDCGMFQGKGMETDAMNRNLGFEPQTIDYLFLSHAHIDHAGLIPYLYKNGFRGSIFCTNSTRDLCALMLQDSAFIQELDIVWFNKKRKKNNLPPVEPIYTTKDATKCMELFVGLPANKRIYIDENISVMFSQTSHMLGASAVNIEINENDTIKRICFTGDIGRSKSKILRPAVDIPQCDYLIMESTYGDRLHAEDSEISKALFEVIHHTCVEKKGKLIIPSFSVGRTQEIVYELNLFHNQGLLPKIDVFVDSPLAVNATEVFKMHTDVMNDDVHYTMLYDADPFGFSSLHYVRSKEESQMLNSYNKPCIILSSSGMAEAGRVKHHIANSIHDPKNTILFVGYCAPTTLGARLQQHGIKEISIFGEVRKVKADICKIEGFSGHADRRELLDFVKPLNRDQVKTVFVVHGEKEVADKFRETLHSVGFQNVEVPEQFQSFKL